MKTQDQKKQRMNAMEKTYGIELKTLTILRAVSILSWLAFAWFMGWSINKFLSDGILNVWFDSIVLSLIVSIGLISYMTEKFVRSNHRTKIESTLRMHVFEHLMDAQSKPSEMINSDQPHDFLTSGVHQLSVDILSFRPNQLQGWLGLVGSLSLITIINIWFGIGYLLFTLISMIVRFAFIQRIFDSDADFDHRNMALQRYLMAIYQHKKVVLAKELEFSVKEGLKTYQMAYEDTQNRSIRSHRKPEFVNTFLMIISSILLIVFGYIFIIENRVSFGSLSSVFLLAFLLHQSWMVLLKNDVVLSRMMASLNDLIEIENMPKKFISDKRAIDKFEKIVAKNLQIAYQNRPLFLDLNFTVPTQSIVQIIDDTGSGKDYLMDLFLGLIDPTSGFMTITHKRQKHIIGPETRNVFAYVPKHDLFLPGTIRDNLRGTADMTEDQLKAACQIACIYDEIKSLPKGFDTMLGFSGIGLERNQLQRLSIARALLQDSLVLLMDEVTSDLDRNTEERILQNIKRLTDKTCFIVSKRILDTDVIDMEIILKNE